MNTKVYLIQLKDTDSKFEFPGFALYTKGAFCCIAYYNKEGEKRVKRYPLCNIHDIDTTY